MSASRTRPWDGQRAVAASWSSAMRSTRPAAPDEAGLRRLEQEGIILMSAKQVYYEWLRTLAAVRAFDAAHPDLANPPGFSL